MLAVLLFCIVFLVLQKTIADPDILWHLRNAQMLFHNHRLVRHDHFSFTTAGQPWIDPEWLAELPFYLGWRWFGERGVFFVAFAAIEAVLLGIYALAFQQSRSIKAAFLVSFTAIFLAGVSFGPRTLLFGWVFLVVELAVLYSFHAARDLHDPRNSIWMLPPLFLLWVNTHGSWIIGLVLLALFTLSGCVEGTWGLIESRRWTRSQLRRLAAVSALSVLALFVNPYGWRLAFYPFDMAFHQKLNIANVQEWKSLDFHTPRGKIVLVLIAGTVLMQLVRKRRWMLHEVAFLLLGFYAALTYTRFLFLAAILILPLLAQDLAGKMPYYPERDKPWLNAPIMAALIAAVVSLFPSNAQLNEGWAKMYPQQALPYLQDFHPAGNVFTYYDWGGYLIWHVRRMPVFMDSRVDIFEHRGVLADYLDAVRLKNTFAVFDKYSIRYVLFPQDAPLSYMLQHTPGWKIEYQDRTATLFERTELPRQGIQGQAIAGQASE